MEYLERLHLPMPDDPLADELVEALEAGIWQQVRGEQTGLRNCVHYGSDNPLDAETLLSGLQPRPSSRTGAGAPQNTQHHPYGAWATALMPKGPQSIFTVLDFDVLGVTTGLFYLALLAAAFCWHVEDQCFASYNMLYAGYPKLWYIVRPGQMLRFRRACKAMGITPSLATMADLERLRQHGVDIRRVVQRAGEIVITFPGAFHGGFNLGPNVAEAANMAYVDWLPHGRRASEDDREQGRAPVVAFERLVLALATSAVLPTSAFFSDRAQIRKELEVLLEKEEELRHSHRYYAWCCFGWWVWWVMVAEHECAWHCGDVVGGTCRGTVVVGKVGSEDGLIGPKVSAALNELDEQRSCVDCKQPCVLSGMTCDGCQMNTGGKRGAAVWRCLQHACSCPGRLTHLLVSLEKLQDMIQRLA